MFDGAGFFVTCACGEYFGFPPSRRSKMELSTNVFPGGFAPLSANWSAFSPDASNISGETKSVHRRLDTLIAHLLPPMPTVLKRVNSVSSEDASNMQIIPLPGTEAFQKWQSITNPRDSFAASQVVALIHKIYIFNFTLHNATISH